MSMTQEQREVLRTIAGIEDAPPGAFNIRVDGASIGSDSTSNIKIVFKEGGTGMDIYVEPGTKSENVYIPVVISKSGHNETVLNDFHIGADSDIKIIAGCGIHNCGSEASEHDGIHAFHVGENARVLYVENHYGAGEGSGERILNPVTKVYQQKNSHVEMEMVQIEGVDSTKRETYADLDEGASLVIKEKLMTSGKQYAETFFEVNMNGAECTADVASRSVAKGQSEQVFISKLNGNAACRGHSECDAIIMDEASVRALPEVAANNVDAALIHEAAIGKIAGEQIVKLMTLGLTEQEAETQIVNGFLK